MSPEFVGLGQTVTHCQTQEAGADCLTRRHQETVLATCGCAPAYLRSQYGAETGVCSPSALDCVARLTLPHGECLEHCQGSIMGVERLDTVRDQEGLERYIAEYEKFKNKQENLTFPIGMKGESNRRGEGSSFNNFKIWSLRAS